MLKDGQGVTVSCAEGDTGFIFEGELGFDIRKNSVDAMPDLPFLDSGEQAHRLVDVTLAHAPWEEV